VVPCDWTGDTGHKLKHRRSHLNIRKLIFTVRVTEHRHRFPREIVVSPSLEMIKSHLHTIMDNLLLVVLLGQRGCTR